jgi:hypothetical protein
VPMNMRMRMHPGIAMRVNVGVGTNQLGAFQ